jgi:hypothetical protein
MEEMKMTRKIEEEKMKRKGNGAKSRNICIRERKKRNQLK